jgi:hypothetical protein
MTQKELASAIGVSADTMTNMLWGTRKISVGELDSIFETFGLETIRERLTVTVPPRQIAFVNVVGAVAAGIFREMNVAEFAPYQVAYSPDPRWAQADLRAYVVKGESINRQAEDGDHVVVLPTRFAPRQHREGDWVVVNRVRGDLIEVSVRLVREGPDGVELHSDSTDTRYARPIVLSKLDGVEKVEVIGFVLDFLRAGTRF